MGHAAFQCGALLIVTAIVLVIIGAVSNQKVPNEIDRWIKVPVCISQSGGEQSLYGTTWDVRSKYVSASSASSTGHCSNRGQAPRRLEFKLSHASFEPGFRYTPRIYRTDDTSVSGGSITVKGTSGKSKSWEVAGWKKCADSGSTCVCSAQARYGMPGVWKYKSVSGSSIQCSRESFSASSSIVETGYPICECASASTISAPSTNSGSSSSANSNGRRRREMLKGGFFSSSSGSSSYRSYSSYSSGGYSGVYRRYRGYGGRDRTYLYLGTGSRHRTHTGYTQRSQVQAADTGMVVTAVTGSGQQSLSALGKRSVASSTGVVTLNPYYKSTYESTTLASSCSTPEGCDYEIFQDLSADQIGEDDASDAFVVVDKDKNLGTVEVSVEFEFYYDSHLAAKKSRDVSFPSVWITFVSEDEKPGSITNWLFYVLAFVCVVYAFLIIKTGEEDFVDAHKDMIEDSCSCLSSRGNGSGSSSRSALSSSSHASYIAPPPPSSSSSSSSSSPAQFASIGGHVNLSNEDYVSMRIGKAYHGSSVDLHNNDIRSLTGMEMYHDLTQLNVDDNNLSSLYGINTAPRITELRAANNDLRDLSGLSSSTLKSLIVPSNDITNLHGIIMAPMLESLSVEDNNIIDVSGIAGRAPMLRWINVKNNNVKSLDGLETCGMLREVHAPNNDIKDIGALLNMADACPFLEKVDLTDNDISKSKQRELNYVYLQKRPACVLLF